MNSLPLDTSSCCNLKEKNILLNKTLAKTSKIFFAKELHLKCFKKFRILQNLPKWVDFVPMTVDVWKHSWEDLYNSSVFKNLFKLRYETWTVHCYDFDINIFQVNFIILHWHPDNVDPSLMGFSSCMLYW